MGQVLRDGEKFGGGKFPSGPFWWTSFGGSTFLVRELFWWNPFGGRNPRFGQVTLVGEVYLVRAKIWPSVSNSGGIETIRGYKCPRD